MGIITIVAVAFGILYAWSLYKRFKEANDEDKPKLVKIYAFIAILSIVLFVGIRLFVPKPEIEIIEEPFEGIYELPGYQNENTDYNNLP